MVAHEEQADWRRDECKVEEVTDEGIGDLRRL